MNFELFLAVFLGLCAYHLTKPLLDKVISLFCGDSYTAGLSRKHTLAMGRTCDGMSSGKTIRNR